ncbi:hypothetical protein [Streptomyces sp. NPDC006875]|uniref:hypothetical protein n=1 Tax=Streptomyces sp. NPDC006875 TaxID=3154781 RepID=UPI0033F9D83C
MRTADGGVRARTVRSESAYAPAGLVEDFKGAIRERRARPLETNTTTPAGNVKQLR